MFRMPVAAMRILKWIARLHPTTYKNGYHIGVHIEKNLYFYCLFHPITGGVLLCDRFANVYRELSKYQFLSVQKLALLIWGSTKNGSKGGGLSILDRIYVFSGKPLSLFKANGENMLFLEFDMLERCEHDRLKLS